MAIVHDADSKGITAGYPGATSLTVSHTITGSNTLLVVGVVAVPSSGSASTPTGVTFNGVAMTLLDFINCPSGRQNNSFWYLIAPASGTHDIVASIAANHCMGLIACSFTGVLQTGSLDIKNEVTGGSGTTLTCSITTTVANDLVIAHFTQRDIVENSGGLLLGCSQISGGRQNTANGEGTEMGYKIVAAAGAYSSCWSQTYDADKSIEQAAFKEAPPSAAGRSQGLIF